MINKGKERKHLFVALREEVGVGNGVNERKSLLMLLFFFFFLHWDWVFLGVWLAGGIWRFAWNGIWTLGWDWVGFWGLGG